MNRDEVLWAAARMLAQRDDWPWDLLTDRAKQDYLDTAEVVVDVAFAAVRDNVFPIVDEPAPFSPDLDLIGDLHRGQRAAWTDPR